MITEVTVQPRLLFMEFRHVPNSRSGITPLQCAVLNGDLAEFNRLLKEGEHPSDTNNDGWSALHFAAQEHRPDMVSLLLERGAIVDAPDIYGNTPLGRAVFDSRGRGEVIALLRAAGADPMLANHYGISPVSAARTISNYDVRQFFDDLEPTHSA